VDLRTWFTALPTAASASVYVFMLAGFAAGMWRRKRDARQAARAPAVTIFKPLAGADDELEDNLESFARIDYPSFEMLLGVASADDPAYEVARRFVARHAKKARLVLTDRDAATNPKVAQLIALDRRARGEVVVISDSNVRVQPSYLWSLVRELCEPGVGMACSVFAGTGERTVGAALENLQIGALVGPGIVSLSVYTSTPFSIGKSMAMWRRDLARLGGFGRVGEVLAEDHVLGRLVLAEKLEIRTSLEPVENRNVDCSVRRTLERHSRWAKMRRALHPVAFALEPLISPLVVATVTALVVQTKASVAIACAAALLQTVLAFASTRLFRGHGMRWYYAPLEIVRTYIVLLCWAQACLSRRIEWRGHAFLVLKDSYIVPAPKSSGRWRAAAERLLAW
jgi:ceramide glucosyltransferase